MKIVFIGSVEIGFKALRQIIKDGQNVADVFTLAKKYAGSTSGYVDFSSLCVKNGIRIHKVRDVNERINVEKIRKTCSDLVIICGWQRLVCKEILDMPRLGTVGFHSSLLPKYRGHAPVNWAIIKGEKKTGVTMFYCDPEADTGDIIEQKRINISISDTCGTVYDKCAVVVCRLLYNLLPKIEKGAVKTRKNPSSRAYFWPKRRPEDGRINWNKKSRDIHNWIRALTKPYPGAFTYFKKEKYFIWASVINKKYCGKRGRPGEVLSVSYHCGQQAMMVATGDRPIMVSNITREKSSSKKNNLKVGDVFS